jgi:hypothetical protein
MDSFLSSTRYPYTKGILMLTNNLKKTIIALSMVCSAGSGTTLLAINPETAICTLGAIGATAVYNSKPIKDGDTAASVEKAKKHNLKNCIKTIPFILGWGLFIHSQYKIPSF